MAAAEQLCADLRSSTALQAALQTDSGSDETLYLLLLLLLLVPLAVALFWWWRRRRTSREDVDPFMPTFVDYHYHGYPDRHVNPSPYEVLTPVEGESPVEWPLNDWRRASYATPVSGFATPLEQAVPAGPWPTPQHPYRLPPQAV